ncbi:hypothetical protein DL764_005949 [Monosporascus ibericus]|uniref:Threonine synthase N-terminal domain-containing protein n=1 Tax=Monosporascus ibericus TaxID=155417 RepID=A0A4Q4T9H3_9PEZI|nr:hypothetical protein DL764_005949 [Monosporascus ibericus]
MADDSKSKTHTESQIFLSTRGGDYGLSFETVVLKGLAPDGGLFLPHVIPTAADWRSWKDLTYEELALQIFSLYISSSEIPTDDLRGIIDRSYSTFREKDVAPLVDLQDDHLYLLELFHGPSYSFKDSIYGLRGKKDVSVVILHPKGRISPIQEAQMTTCTDANVNNLAVAGTFDDCQDIVKALFSDPDTNQALKLGAVNSINFSRILAQIVYYFYSYFSLVKKSNNFKLGDKGDILAGYFATRMGLPVDKLVIATNENDILDRFWKTGRYEKKPARGEGADGGLDVDGAKAHEDGVKETLSPAMDILVSSNFERLLWFLAYEFAASVGMDEEFTRKQAGQEVSAWLKDLKDKGGFGPVHEEILDNARKSFESERVSDPQTLETIKSFYNKTGYILDPHSAVGVTAATRSMQRAESDVPHISLSTAHPAKFAGAVELALKDKDGFNFEKEVLPQEFIGLEEKPKRVTDIENDWKAVREWIKARIDKELSG